MPESRLDWLGVFGRVARPTGKRMGSKGTCLPAWSPHQSPPVFTHSWGQSHCAMALEVAVWSDRISPGTWGGGSFKGYT